MYAVVPPTMLVIISLLLIGSYNKSPPFKDLVLPGNVNFSVITTEPPLGALVFNSTTVAEFELTPSTVDNKVGFVVLLKAHKPLTGVETVNVFKRVFWNGLNDILYSLM